MTLTSDSTRLLRRALQANAAFSTWSALMFVFAAGSLASFLGILSSGQVTGLGVQLAVFALWLWWLSTRAVIPRWQVWLAIALDILWVAGSVQLILSSPPALTPAAKWAVGIVADIVAVFALLQYLGLRRAAKTTAEARA
jgi:hypothetical protein